MSKLTPAKTLLKIQKIKYKFLAVPIIVIILTFLLNLKYENKIFSIISLIALVIFFVISRIFSVNKSVHNPEKSGKILAPINGKIVKKQRNELIIKKSIFAHAEIRKSDKENKLALSIKGFLLYDFAEEDAVQAQIIGLLPGPATAVCQLPENYHFTVEETENIEAGETVIAELGQ